MYNTTSNSVSTVPSTWRWFSASHSLLDNSTVLSATTGALLHKRVHISVGSVVSLVTQKEMEHKHAKTNRPTTVYRA